MTTCSNCYLPIQSNDIAYCPRCGTKINSIVVDQNPSIAGERYQETSVSTKLTGEEGDNHELTFPRKQLGEIVSNQGTNLNGTGTNLNDQVTATPMNYRNNNVSPQTGYTPYQSADYYNRSNPAFNYLNVIKKNWSTEAPISRLTPQLIGIIILAYAVGGLAIIWSLYWAFESLPLFSGGSFGIAIGSFVLLFLSIPFSFGLGSVYLARRLHAGDRVARAMAICLYSSAAIAFVLTSSTDILLISIAIICIIMVLILALDPKTKLHFVNANSGNPTQPSFIVAARFLMIIVGGIIFMIGLMILPLAEFSRILIIYSLLDLAIGVSIFVLSRYLSKGNQAACILTTILAAIYFAVNILSGHNLPGMLIPVGLSISVVLLLWVPSESRHFFGYSDNTSNGASDISRSQIQSAGPNFGPQISHPTFTEPVTQSAFIPPLNNPILGNVAGIHQDNFDPNFRTNSSPNPSSISEQSSFYEAAYHGQQNSEVDEVSTSNQRQQQTSEKFVNEGVANSETPGIHPNSESFGNYGFDTPQKHSDGFDRSIQPKRRGVLARISAILSMIALLLSATIPPSDMRGNKPLFHESYIFLTFPYCEFWRFKNYWNFQGAWQEFLSEMTVVACIFVAFSFVILVVASSGKRGGVPLLISSCAIMGSSYIPYLYESYYFSNSIAGRGTLFFGSTLLVSSIGIILAKRDQPIASLGWSLVSICGFMILLIISLFEMTSNNYNRSYFYGSIGPSGNSGTQTSVPTSQLGNSGNTGGNNTTTTVLQYSSGPSGGTTNSWTISAVASGGYTESVELQIGNPEHASSGAVNGNDTASNGCSFNSQTDALIPFTLVSTNTTSNFPAVVGVDMSGLGSIDSSNSLEFEGYYSNGVQCSSSGSFGVDSTVAVSSGGDSILDGFFLITNYYSPSFPSGNTGLLANSLITVISTTYFSPTQTNSNNSGNSGNSGTTSIYWQVKSVSGSSSTQTSGSWQFNLAGSANFGNSGNSG